MLSSDVGGKPETSHGVVTCHKVTLRKKPQTKKSQLGERITDGTTAEESSGENPRQNHSQRASGEKNEITQQGYEDSVEEHEDLER